ncbi:addiction module HigA family antidote [Sphingobium sp. B2D3A]|uniref:HigA family addiction module antitoxin n=1 Tax=unclassified Sphingobium TaxID=2611147 RepID=UPI0022249CAD|nr:MULTISPECIES: HigA family addiction module antitoxin [unclassified Sphingobium]MCW2338910.1 addiction module HigA family antidote [Sphingobium sp. B2D3A]MCW2385335.1 addiction module HigA family antidote [Sphingobium sp. B2D3D]MCW2411301.1 addiction module HigA family antidote [Sphingobium sp. B8D3D]MCW2416407.1 addiction module HigA family antidote [Sphingobium sp. B8D3A]
MSGSRTITEDDGLLDNVHPGSILREDFLVGSEISLDEVVTGAGVEKRRLSDVLAEVYPVDANMDLRLARYFGVSEGFFLGLQIDYDLEEERRVHGRELAKIVPRAA